MLRLFLFTASMLCTFSINCFATNDTTWPNASAEADSLSLANNNYGFPDTAQLYKHIDSLEHIDNISIADLLTLDSLYTERRLYRTWRDLSFKYELGKRKELELETRKRLFKEIRAFPFYTTHHHFFRLNFVNYISVLLVNSSIYMRMKKIWNHC